MVDKSFNRTLMQVVGPLLIILMIGALVYFLIEVFYRGPHAARLGWVFGLFTAAAVLVSRISVEEGMERAALFGFALAAATFVVTLQLVDFEYGALSILKPVVVLFFIAIVMWSANRLTWDCTVIDESRDVSSIGLIELVKRKFLKRNKQKKRSSDVSEFQSENSSSTSPDATPEQADLEHSVGSKFLFLFFANSKTKNTPGLWIFYFALAAFPIFGFGQWFARPDEGWGYRWIFFLFAVYLGAALGLLMMTSLLGLERYLKKRGADMPGSVSRTWMTVGTLFALGIMLVMLALPSPSLSLGFEDALSYFTTDNNNTSKHAVGKDGQEQGENPQGEKAAEKADGAKQKPGDKGEGNGGKSKNGKSDGNSKGDSKGKQGDKSKGDSSKGDKSKGNQKDNSKDSNQEKSDSKNEKKSDNDRQRKQEQDKNNAKQNQAKNNQPKQNNAKQQKQNQRKQGNQNRQNNQQQQPQQASSPPSQLAKALGTIMRFLVYGVGLIVLGVVLWMFRDELAKLWNDLFGSTEEKEEKQSRSEAKTKPTKPLPPFSNYQNPFASGMALKSRPAQTIQYTFNAFEAWCRDQGIARGPDQTPHEFARKIPHLFSLDGNEGVNKTNAREIASEAKKLADMHGECLYSGLDIEASIIGNLKRIWQLMDSNLPRSHEQLQVLVNTQ